VLPWGEVLMFDYPGYGDSTGTPTTESFSALRQDMGSYIDGLARGRPLVLWGHSIGGLICSGLAEVSREADAVILETTGPSFAVIAETLKPWFAPFVKTAVKDSLRTYEVSELLKDFKGPIFVVGAGKDERLPVKLARSLAAALKGRGLRVAYHEYPGANHFNAALNSTFAGDAVAFFKTVALHLTVVTSISAQPGV
jgi:pimeloyl-ACP methyl ester carboxylesterase